MRKVHLLRHDALLTNTSPAHKRITAIQKLVDMASCLGQKCTLVYLR